MEHIWYSEEQRKELNRQGYKRNIAKLKDGKFVEYTEMTKDNKPSGVWKDYLYLGVGDWHHTV